MPDPKGGERDQFLHQQAQEAKKAIDQLADAHAQDVRQDVAKHIKTLEGFLDYVKKGMPQKPNKDDE